ncbi:MAG: CinA family nicotinamide mononucleotide deamidase-related protein [Thermomicrobiales bacterium]|nr:CinA family nicotinamide mononucleotide deamidase-related protein [Thermomicrobiales bacterium]
MRAYILSIGSELIGGHLTDTNATFLAQELAAKGIELLHVVQVGDDLERLTAVLERATADADLVICTGGIGPTDDDLTREAIAALAGETPVVDDEAVAAIQAFFAQRGLEMPARNAKQAWVIPSVEILPNPVGTAPGWFARINGAVVAAMPGVPREMTRMWREQVSPRLGEQFGGAVFRSTNLRTLGIGESAVSEILDELTQRPQPYVGTYAKNDGVHVRVTATGATAAVAESELRATVDEVRRRLADYIYADDDRSLALVLLDSLRARNLTIAVSESGTAGRFGSLLLAEPAASGLVTGLAATALESEPAAAAALAQDAITRHGSDVGVGVVVAATPAHNGLFEGIVEVAVSGALQGEASFPIRAAFIEIQRRSAMHAADVLRKALA